MSNGTISRQEAIDTRRYTFGNDEFSLEAAYHDCKMVFDGITDDVTFQTADTGLILYYANEIIYALQKALEDKDINDHSNCSESPTSSTLQPTCNQLAIDCIDRQAAIDAAKRVLGDHEISRTMQTALHILPSAQPEHTCLTCGRTANNGGWYKDGGTRCPIEEHYALPKDGHCHLWEKQKPWEDDYPERRTDG